MKWHPEAQKPTPFKTLLLALTGEDYAIGHWAPKPQQWIVFDCTQWHAFHSLEDGAVKYWCEIEPPTEADAATLQKLRRTMTRAGV